MRAAIAVLCATLFVPCAASAQTEPADAQLGAVRELVLRATYRDALTAANAFLARTDLDAAHRAAGLEVLGIVQLALRDEAGARQTLAELYARDPGHRLEDPDASPVVQSAFAHARDSATALTVELTDTTVAAPATHAPPIVSVHLGAHADVVQELRISYRLAGDAHWATLVTTPEPTGDAEGVLAVAGASHDAFTVEYHVEALAPSDAVVARLGSADDPLHIAVPMLAESAVADPFTGTPVVSSGGGVETEAWFWIVIGVVVVGAGVGIGLGLTLGQPQSARDGTLGNATLPLVSF